VPEGRCHQRAVRRYGAGNSDIPAPRHHVEQPRRVHRLDQVRVEARLGRAAAVLLAAEARQRHQPHGPQFRLRAQPLRHFVPAHAGQPQVE